MKVSSIVSNYNQPWRELLVTKSFLFTDDVMTNDDRRPRRRHPSQTLYPTASPFSLCCTV